MVHVPWRTPCNPASVIVQHGEGRDSPRQAPAATTGADHCQHDNPTIGQELMTDWLADVFGIDQRALLKKAVNPLI